MVEALCKLGFSIPLLCATTESFVLVGKLSDGLTVHTVCAESTPYVRIPDALYGYHNIKAGGTTDFTGVAWSHHCADGLHADNL